jgi:pimeloyl-ACP methyl ester carboxylesterase
MKPLGLASRLWTGRVVRSLLVTLCGLAVVAGGGYYLTHYYDPVRIIYKRMKAPDKYVFEEIHPRYLETDPARLITIHTGQDAARVRAAAIEVIWGGEGLPEERAVESVEEGIADPRFADLSNLAQIDRIRIEMDNGVHSVAYHFKPARENGRLVLYHHGYAGTFHDAKHVIAALLEEGYGVIALNYLGYGGNWGRGHIYLPRFGWYAVGVHRLLDLVDRPMMYFIEPAIVAVNYARRLGSETVDMIGFSAGGWTTIVAAAVDPRIRRSYPIAGTYPIYLRSGQERHHSAPPQYYGPLLEAANYLEMFVLGARGDGRRQLQVFNRFDRCCFRNTLARLYEPAVAERVAGLGAGSFAVLIDETHADHKIAEFALEAIVEDLARP